MSSREWSAGDHLEIAPHKGHACERHKFIHRRATREIPSRPESIHLNSFDAAFSTDKAPCAASREEAIYLSSAIRVSEFLEPTFLQLACLSLAHLEDKTQVATRLTRLHLDPWSLKRGKCLDQQCKQFTFRELQLRLHPRHDRRSVRAVGVINSRQLIPKNISHSSRTGRQFASYVKETSTRHDSRVRSVLKRQGADAARVYRPLIERISARKTSLRLTGR